MVDRYLRFVAAEGVFQPRNHRHDRDGKRHAEIGDHFPEVAQAVGDRCVKYTEKDDQYLPRDVSLRDENQRGGAENGSEQVIILRIPGQ